MAEQTALPEPVEGEVWLPLEWIEERGPVKWTKLSTGDRCDDCLHCILDHINGVAPRAPGLARKAYYRRSQGTNSTRHCREHAAMRKQKEESNG